MLLGAAKNHIASAFPGAYRRLFGGHFHRARLAFGAAQQQQDGRQAVLQDLESARCPGDPFLLVYCLSGLRH